MSTVLNQSLSITPTVGTPVNAAAALPTPSKHSQSAVGEPISQLEHLQHQQSKLQTLFLGEDSAAPARESHQERVTAEPAEPVLNPKSLKNTLFYFTDSSEKEIKNRVKIFTDKRLPAVKTSQNEHTHLHTHFDTDYFIMSIVLHNVKILNW